MGDDWDDAHNYGFSMWMAGTSIHGGRALGATDDFGVNAVDMKVDAHDVNASILRLLGIDHTRLTYFYQGRDHRLTDVDGQHEFTGKLLTA